MIAAVALASASTAAAHGITVRAVHHTGRASCAPSSAHILEADSQAATYTVRERIKTKFETSTVISTRGCVDGVKGSYKLGEELVPEPFIPAGRIKRLVLAGTMVAYEVFVSGYNYYGQLEGVSEWHVYVRNLRTGRFVHVVPTGVAGPVHPNFIGNGEAVDIVLKSDGAVAWINSALEDESEALQGKNNYQVHALDSTGERVLAVGLAIEPQSLALAQHALLDTGRQTRICDSELTSVDSQTPCAAGTLEAPMPPRQVPGRLTLCSPRADIYCSGQRQPARNSMPFS